MKSVIVWYNPKKDIYFYKVIYNLFGRYYEGFVNQYGHVVVLVIDIYKDLIYKEPLRNKVINRLIRFLQNKRK